MLNWKIENRTKIWGPLLCLLIFNISGQINATELERGKYLTAAGGCMACHTALEKGATAYAGGHALKTPFGIFYTPNITPDVETGIGGWQKSEFLAALKQGIRPDGSHYFPAFPYPSYTQMTDEDALSIFAYLKSLDPVVRKNRDHDVSAPFSWRWLQWGWKLLFFSDKPYSPSQGATAEEQRGGYLTNALGHCAECHTPRNVLGGMVTDGAFSGVTKTDTIGEVPNITPDVKTGIGDWSLGDIVSFLETGMKPDFDDVQGNMEEVILYGTSKLTAEDRAAMAAYLKSLPAIQHKTSK